MELLVIIGILATLTAILLPRAARGPRPARPATCTANLQQYSRAFGMYLQDYDETFPCWVTNTPYRPGELKVTTWDLLLQSYLHHPDAARCPRDPSPAFFEFADGTRVWRSYAPPRNLIWLPDPRNPRAVRYPLKLATVTEPVGTLLLIEKNQGAAVNGWPYPETNKPRCWPCASAIENYQQGAWERHGGRLPVLFVDGHGRALAGPRLDVSRVRAPSPAQRCRWPHLDGYVFRPGVGAAYDLQANGDQFWEFCPLPGEEPNRQCLP
jgi:prepilin-type processing-associated H-X9-DG protein